MWVWHSNWSPQLILSYYLDTLDMLGHKYSLVLHWYVNLLATRYAHGDSEQPWDRKLWHCQCTHYALPMA